MLRTAFDFPSRFHMRTYTGKSFCVLSIVISHKPSELSRGAFGKYCVTTLALGINGTGAGTGAAAGGAGLCVVCGVATEAELEGVGVTVAVGFLEELPLNT